jgi:hypothetical protein
MDLILPMPMSVSNYKKQRRTEASHYQLAIGVDQPPRKSILPKIVEEFDSHPLGVLLVYTIPTEFFL